MNDGSIKTEATIEAVQRVIGYMYDNLGGEITIDDMARTAMFSKFHLLSITTYLRKWLVLLCSLPYIKAHPPEIARTTSIVSVVQVALVARV